MLKKAGRTSGNKSILAARVGLASGFRQQVARTTYLFRDLFTTARAAGAIGGTAAEPGPGNRTIQDTGGQVSISGGQLVVTGVAPASANPWMREGSFSRAAGRTIAMRFKSAAGKKVSFLGMATAAAAPGPAVYKGGVSEDYWSFQFGSGVGASRYMYLYDTCWHEVIFQLRSTGCAYYINEGEGPHLVWISTTDNAATLELAYRSTSGDDVDLVSDSWANYGSLQPLTATFSDGFERADGALGVTDGAGHAEANSGVGYSWVNNVGTFAVSSNAAAASALSGGLAIATVDTGDQDGMLRAAATRSAGNIGIVARYVDENNYYRVYHDGTNLKADQIIGGVVTNLLSNAVTYSAGREVWIKCDGVHFRFGYGEVSFGGGFGIDSTPSQDQLTGTRWGLYTSDTGNSISGCALFPIRREFQRDDAMLGKAVYCVGDSISAYVTNYQSTFRKLLGDGWCTVDCGVAGYTALKLQSRFSELVTRHKPEYVVILAGINDVLAGASASTVEGRLSSMYSAAKSAGITVVAVTMTPFKNNVGWNSDRQIVADEVNSWILSTAENVDYRVDAYTALEDPGAPDALLAAYDSGDHIHPSAAGYSVLGTTIYNGATWA